MELFCDDFNNSCNCKQFSSKVNGIHSSLSGPESGQ